MDSLLRKLAEWKARSRAAQVIVFDGGAEVERSRAFMRGAMTGIVLTLLVFLLAAPQSPDPVAAEVAHRRGEMLREANERLAQAVQVAQVCLSTAENLERTLSSYQTVLGGRMRPAGSPP
jgi:hypothetical protein